jgi:hypothetical protein
LVVGDVIYIENFIRLSGATAASTTTPKIQIIVVGDNTELFDPNSTLYPASTVGTWMNNFNLVVRITEIGATGKAEIGLNVIGSSSVLSSIIRISINTEIDQYIDFRVIAKSAGTLQTLNANAYAFMINQTSRKNS